MTQETSTALPTTTNQGVTPQETPKKRVYKSVASSMQMITTGGKRILFVSNRHITADEDVINYLDKEIRNGCKDVFIDTGEMYYDPKLHDPIAALRHKLREEILEEMKKVSGDPGRDMGNSIADKFTPANTQTIASVAAGSGPANIGNIKVGK